MPKDTMVQPTLPRRPHNSDSGPAAADHLPRSRACITCRRRKVKCDEGKPHCQRCVSRGCDCEGYESQPARAIKTQQALLKRWKPKQDNVAVRQRNSLSGQQHVFAVSIEADDLSAGKHARAVPEKHPEPSLPLTVWSPGANESRFIRIFLDSYMPSDGQGPHKWYNPWLCHVLDTQDAYSTPTLNACVRAVTLTNVGRRHADDTLVAEGKRLYVKALCMLQKCLLSDKKSFPETTLLATRTLALYELFEHTDPFAWLRHQEGLEMLVQARGWKEFQSSQRSYGLLGFRDTVMFRAFCRRRKPFLTSEPWKMTPIEDPSSIDDFHEMVVDIGLVLADALADSNLSIEQLDQGTLSLEHVEMCFEKLEECDRRLNKWIADYRKWIRMPLYTTVFSSKADDLNTYHDKHHSDDSYEEHLEYRFPTFKHAVAVLYYWSMQVCLDMLFEELVDLTGVPWTPSSEETPGIDERLARRLDLCAHLLRTVAPLMRMGAVGPTRCLFGWDTAMGALQKEQGGAMAEALLYRGREIHVQYMTRARMGVVGRGQFRRGQSEGPRFGSPDRQRVILRGKGEHHQPLYMDFGMKEVGDKVVLAAVADGCRA